MHSWVSLFSIHISLTGHRKVLVVDVPLLNNSLRLHGHVLILCSSGIFFGVSFYDVFRFSDYVAWNGTMIGE
jgi:hypothetical protein